MNTKRLVRMIAMILFLVLGLSLFTGCGKKAKSDIELSAFPDGAYPVRFNGKWGLVSQSGEVLIDYLYEECHLPTEGLWATNLKKTMPLTLNPNWGFVNSQNEEVVPPVYTGCLPFSDGLAVVSKGSGCGAVNAAGKIIIPMKYEDLSSYRCGLMVAKKEGHWGAINSQNDVVVEVQYDAICNNTEGYGDYNSDEERVNNICFKDNVAAVKKDDAWGVVDTAGNFVILLSQVNHDIKIQNNRILTSKDADWQGCTLYDTLGNVQRDGMKSVLHTTNDALLVKFGEADIRIIDWNGNDLVRYSELLPGDEKLAGWSNWPELGSATESGWFVIPCHSGNSNLVNLQGQRLLPDFAQLGETTSAGNYIAVNIIKENGNVEGAVYNTITGQQERTVEGELQIWNPRCGVIDGTTMLRLSDGERFVFSKVEQENDRVAIVFDEDSALCGLFVLDSPAYPTQYDSIRYDADGSLFVLEQGSAETVIRVAVDGAVLQMEA